jgi:hypothetical protein
MPQSMCIRCQKTEFEAVSVPKLRGSDFSWTFLQCANCGGVVGAIDDYALSELNERLEAICDKLGIRGV